MTPYINPKRTGSKFSIAELTAHGDDRIKQQISQNSYWLCHHDMIQALGPLAKVQGKEVISNPYHQWFRASVAKLESLDDAKRRAQDELLQMNESATIFIAYIQGAHWICEYKTQTGDWETYNPPGDGMCGDHVAKHIYDEIRATLRKVTPTNSAFPGINNTQVTQELRTPYIDCTHSEPLELRKQTIKMCTSIQQPKKTASPRFFSASPVQHKLENKIISNVSTLFNKKNKAVATVTVDLESLAGQLEVLSDHNFRTADLIKESGSKMIEQSDATQHDSRIAAVLQLEEIKAYKNFKSSMTTRPATIKPQTIKQEHERTTNLSTLFKNADRPKPSKATPPSLRIIPTSSSEG